MSTVRKARAFVLIEGIAVLAVLVLLGLMLALSASDARRRAMLAASEENLHRIAATTDSYAADNAGLYWGLSWKKGEAHSQWPDLNNAASDMEAHANQVVDIIRRRADPNFQKIQNWIADLFYSQLTLVDYADSALPARWAASPADGQLIGWQDNKQTAPNTRLPYSSSYELPTSFFDKGDVGARISSGGFHNIFLVPGNCVLGARTTADVAFPSQKVHLYDRYQRHFGKRVAFLGYPEARLPVLFADGSADARMTGDGNKGWEPNLPNSPSPTAYLYQPADWEPPTLSGKPSDQLYGYLRWTRAGISGRDFGGPEVGP